MATSHFELSVEHHIAHLAFNIPQKANALSWDAWEEMKSIFESLDENPNVRVVILSGNGKHFCAGIDLAALMSIIQLDINCEARKRDQIRKFIFKLQDSISAIEKCRKPVIAAIHHGCIGGGVDIIAACDMRYCTQEAYFTIKEVDLGLVADIGTLQRLPTILNPGRMAELAYTGRKVFGPEAKSIGLVNEVYSDKAEMLAAVKDLATTIASKSPLVIRGIKETLLYKRDHSVEESLQQVAIHNAAFLLSRDLEEAFSSTMEKRPAEFKE